jgi:aminopeptidase N
MQIRKIFPMVGILLFSLLQYETATSQQSQNQTFGQTFVADTLDAMDYNIFLSEIDFNARTIKATTTVHLVPKMEINRITLELKSLTVDSVFVEGTRIVNFWQANELLHIPATTTYFPVDTVEVVVYYGGQPFHEGWGGFHFSGDYAFNLGVGFESNPHNLGKAWFPCVDDFQDRATYDVSVRLPNDLTAICGGLLQNVEDEGNGNSIWHWNIAQTIPTYLASVVVGDYALIADTFQGQQAQLPITIYTRPIDSARVAGTFLHLKEILTIYENRFGPYPFDRVGYAGTAIGAMEHVTNIAFPHASITGTLSSEWLLAHELSHMWFGNKVTCAEAGDMWLNEGWATFCHMFFKHDLYNPDIYRQEMNDKHFDVLKNAHITDGSYLALTGVPTEYTYGTTVYDKGATVVHTLMNYLGEEVFFAAVKAYLQEFAYHHAGNDDMRDFLGEYTGVDMTGFFENWVSTPGTPHYSIDSMQVVPDGDQFQAKVFLKQKHKGYDFIGTGNIVEVTFIGAEWQSFTDTVHLDGASGSSVKMPGFEPVVVFCDYFDKTADATSDQTIVIRETGEVSFPKPGFRLYVDAIGDSALFRLTHHWAAPDSLKTPVPGLRLSPYRYWQVAGIFPDNISLHGRFFYNNSQTLDASLILSEQDSVVILYRPDASADWQTVPQSREGLWSIGYIYVDSLAVGEYTLAVWDKTLVGINENKKPTIQEKLLVFPNPADDMINVFAKELSNSTITICDSSGRTTITMDLTQPINQLEVSGWKRGIYMINLLDKEGKVMEIKKVILK